MKVLVFGKTGQVATELQRNATVTALDREQADLSDPEACAAVIAKTNADAIINAAAYTAVDKAEDEEALATTINADAPSAMARAAALRGLPFIHISTDYVFDGQGKTPWLTTDSVVPLGAYGRSKLKGEIGVHQAGGVHAILRTSWVFSAHGQNFVKTMLRLSDTRDALNIVDDQIGGPTPAADIASACLTMATAFHNGQGQTGTYHFSGEQDASWAGFAREIFRQSKRTMSIMGIPSTEYPTPAARPMNSRLNCESLYQEFGITRPDWRTGLTHVLRELGELQK